MQVVERTAMRVVIEHRAPGLAMVTAGIAAFGAAAALIQFLLSQEWLYLLGLAAAGVFLILGLWLAQGVRTTLDASSNTALWERTGLIPARRQAKLADVRGLVLLPSSEEGTPTYTPVLKVGEKRWPLAIRSVTDADAAQGAIAEVLDLAKGRRSL